MIRWTDKFAKLSHEEQEKMILDMLEHSQTSLADLLMNYLEETEVLSEMSMAIDLIAETLDSELDDYDKVALIKISLDALDDTTGQVLHSIKHWDKTIISAQAFDLYGVMKKYHISVEDLTNMIKGTKGNKKKLSERIGGKR